MMDATMDRAILETFPMLVASQSGRVESFDGPASHQIPTGADADGTRSG